VKGDPFLGCGFHRANDFDKSQPFALWASRNELRINIEYANDKVFADWVGDGVPLDLNVEHICSRAVVRGASTLQPRHRSAACASFRGMHTTIHTKAGIGEIFRITPLVSVAITPRARRQSELDRAAQRSRPSVASRGRAGSNQPS
jgi:hypothetical protein